MSQAVTPYSPTQEDKINVCMAFLSYIGEKLKQDEHTTHTITISFTCHSLRGALAPTLALWFKEKQDSWTTQGHAVISCTAFAGATAGNAKFANYSNTLFKDNPIRRIHDTNEMVPHAWSKESLNSTIGDRL